MNSKDHVLRLAVVEREMREMSDSELGALISKTSPEAQNWMRTISNSGEESVDLAALREAMKRGRMKGVVDKVSILLTESCLDDCVTSLGTKADLPSEGDLRTVTPGLVERNGLATTRLMFAAAALADAPAANSIAKVLKADPSLSKSTAPEAKGTAPEAKSTAPEAKSTASEA